jgi:hypothetical protein
MTQTLVFYSVSEQQVNSIYKEMQIEPDEDGFISAATPFGGPLVAQVSFHKPSGQLMVSVIERPVALTLDTIKMKIREALAKAIPVDATIVENQPEVVAPPPF